MPQTLRIIVGIHVLLHALLGCCAHTSHASSPQDEVACGGARCPYHRAANDDAPGIPANDSRNDNHDCCHATCHWLVEAPKDFEVGGAMDPFTSAGRLAGVVSSYTAHSSQLDRIQNGDHWALPLRLHLALTVLLI